VAAHGFAKALCDRTATMPHYRVYDVFTDTPFGGNPLAVFPDAAAIPEDHLQKIAREFNFSETTFVYPPANPDHTAKVRIFTPTREIQFAGHPTIGTTVALSNLGHTGAMTLELGVGPIPCDVSGNTASFTTNAPLAIIATPEPAIVAAAIGLPVTAIETRTHVPMQATLGLAFVFVELKTREDLRQCRPVTDKCRIGAERYPTDLDFAIFAYVRTNNHLDARMFAPLDNMTEDPATGSACATITALLSQIAGAPLAFDIHQGDDMGRPSRIKATALDGDPRPIQIAGSAVLTMEGTFVG
jgi:trans-2,3-dihydro-3-hydroxyanthranilate isomerase